MCAVCGCMKKKGQAGFGKGKGSAMDSKKKTSMLKGADKAKDKKKK